MKVSTQCVIVTGAGHGIGAAIACHLLEQGARVVLADQDYAAVRELAGIYPGHALATAVDVSEETSVSAMVGSTVSHFGRIDALINNAALANPDTGSVAALSLRDWNQVIGTNLGGCFLCSKHVIPLLKQQGGNIINIASTRALQSEPNTEAYAASKGGIIALTHALAVSLGPTIRVNCISPGWIETADTGELRPIDHAQHPAGRIGKPGDIGSMVTYLLSDTAGFITGQNFIIDGGMTRRMFYAE